MARIKSLQTRYNNTLTFAFMHHPYLFAYFLCMPSLHLFTFLFSCFYPFLVLISVRARLKSKKSCFLLSV